MNTRESLRFTGPPILTASELLRLPLEERDSILEKAAILAENLYRNDPSLTDFEAFEAEEADDEAASAG